MAAYLEERFKGRAIQARERRKENVGSLDHVYFPLVSSAEVFSFCIWAPSFSLHLLGVSLNPTLFSFLDSFTSVTYLFLPLVCWNPFPPPPNPSIPLMITMPCGRQGFLSIISTTCKHFHTFLSHTASKQHGSCIYVHLTIGNMKIAQNQIGLRAWQRVSSAT